MAPEIIAGWKKRMENKKKVILLTTEFPYGILETFIEAEMESVPDDIDLTVIPVQVRHPDGRRREIPSGIDVDVIMQNHHRPEYFYKSFCMLFSKFYKNEIRNRKKKGRVTFADRIHIAGYLGRARELADAVYKKYGAGLKEHSIVLYSYWLTSASLSAAMLKEKTGCTVVSRAHGTDIYDGQCFYYTVPAQKDSLSYIDRIYACSRDGRDYLRNKYPEYKDRITHSYLGTKDCGYKEYAGTEKEFVIVSCSRLVPVKRVYLIAETLSHIRGCRIRWVHIGDGPDKEKLSDEIKKLSSDIRVELIGNIAHDDVMNYYGTHHIDLFLNVSASEGLPVSIMEAVSFGIPVVATDVGGTGEIVRKPVGEIIPADFDSKAAAGIIKKYIDMPLSARARLKKDIRTFWENNFSSDRNYSIFYHAITSINPSDGKGDL